MVTLRFRQFNRRILVVLTILAILATAAYGFAASNTVRNSRAGDGAGDISGYTVSNIHYTMDTVNPANISGVTFDLNQPAGSAQVRFGTGGSPATAWSSTYTCTRPGDGQTGWTCAVGAVPAVTVASITQLDVAAAD